MAWSTYSNISQAYPNLSGATTQVSNNIAKRLRGELSPETQMALQDASARYGIASGMPGSGLIRNRTGRDLGRATEDIQRAGEQDFLSTLGVYSGTIAPSAGQALQNQQFGMDFGFRQNQADRQFGLQRNQADLEAAQFNERFGPREYGTTTIGIGGQRQPGPDRYFMTPGGRTANNAEALMFKYRNKVY